MCCLFSFLVDAPKTIEISGVTAVKHDEKEAVYTCSSSASYPEPSIVWNKLVNGKLVKIDEKDTDVDTKYTKSGLLKTSKYRLHPERTQDENVLLYCIVKIQELKFEKSSEVLDILITCKFRFKKKGKIYYFVFRPAKENFHWWSRLCNTW